MSFFEDKVYKDMDWLSQVAEPYDIPMMKLIANAPEVLNIDFKFIEKLKSKSYGSDFSVSNILRVFDEHQYYPQNVSRCSDIRKMLYKCFTIIVEPNTSINIKDRTMNGSIKMIRNKDHFTEHECRKMLEIYTEELLSGLLNATEKSSKYMKTVLELIHYPLDEEDQALFEKESKNYNNNHYVFKKMFIAKLVSATTNQHIRFRTLIALHDFLAYIIDYVSTGSEGAMANIMKVSIMARKNQPIYVVKSNDK